jgi:leucyl aminopeptidase
MTLFDVRASMGNMVPSRGRSCIGLALVLALTSGSAVAKTAAPSFAEDPSQSPAAWIGSDYEPQAMADLLPAAPSYRVLAVSAGALAGAVLGIGEEGGGDPMNRPELAIGLLPSVLPPGLYHLSDAVADARLAAVAWGLGAYRFRRYKSGSGEDAAAQLKMPRGADLECVLATVEAVWLGRDLINTPASDMGPQELEDAARQLARTHAADVSSIVGDDLLARNFPLIHAVGRAAARPPRLIDMSWGDPAAPKVTLVGKGVCFDSGGLDIKSDSAMLLMKKDMGGAASVLALAHMIMDRKLPVRLRVLIPAVENSISGGAFRPLDVYKSRKGLQVEVGNTDAEGRLVLADALALADEEHPDLLVDMGTLTGAARVALGPDLPPFYTDDETLAGDVARHARAAHDPLWRLPLWRPYDAMLDSKVADMNNIATGGFAGSIICALFLNRFVGAAKAWLHLDIYAWTPSPKPGRPEGGECQAARALYALLAERFGG